MVVNKREIVWKDHDQRKCSKQKIGDPQFVESSRIKQHQKKKKMNEFFDTRTPLAERVSLLIDQKVLIYFYFVVGC